MKKVSFLLSLLCCSILGMRAQNTAKFSGNRYEDLANSDEYIYLYNVGAKKFLSPGKAWGTEASLIYDDFGLALTLTGTENGEYTLNSTFSGTGIGTTIGIDDGRGAVGGQRPMEAEMFVDRSNGTQYRFEPVTTSDGSIVYHVILHMVDRDVDCHLFAGSTADEASIEPLNPDDGDYNKEEVLFTENKQDYLDAGGDDADFQWMLISRGDLVTALKEKATDIESQVEPDATFYIQNQGFARGNDALWDTDGNVTYVKKGGTNSFLNHLDNEAYGQYFFTHIDGVGHMYQNLTLTVPGIYRLSCDGFRDPANPSVKMYAWIDRDKDDERDANEVISFDLQGVDNQYSTDYDADDEDNVRAIGKELYNGCYLNKFKFYVSPGDLSNGCTVQIGFYKSVETEDEFPNAIDNIRLHYLGENPFILSDNSTTGTYLSSDTYQSSLTDEANAPHDNVRVYLMRNYRVGTWNTLVLPIDVTKAQLENVFTNGVIVAEAAPSGLAENNDMSIWFKTKAMPTADDDVVLEKGKFYLIYPKGEYKTVPSVQLYRTKNGGTADRIGDKSSRANFKDNNKNIGLIDLGAHSTKGILTPADDGIDVKSADLRPVNSTHNAIRYNGTFTMHAAGSSPVGGDNGPAYVFVQKKANKNPQTTSAENRCEMRYITEQTEIRGFRWWITDVDQNASSGAKPAYIIIDGILDGSEETSIADAFVDETSAPAGIYSASGLLVRQGTTLEGLQPGLYIVNGRKVLVK